MPVGDASAEWPDALSPYRPVARLVLPARDAYDDARQRFVDYEMSFAPARALTDHRPLGGIMRAWTAVYPALAAMRRRENLKPPVEPRWVDDVPG